MLLRHEKLKTRHCRENYILEQNLLVSEQRENSANLSVTGKVFTGNGRSKKSISNYHTSAK